MQKKERAYQAALIGAVAVYKDLLNSLAVSEWISHLIDWALWFCGGWFVLWLLRHRIEAASKTTDSLESGSGSDSSSK